MLRPTAKAASLANRARKVFGFCFSPKGKPEKENAKKNKKKHTYVLSMSCLRMIVPEEQMAAHLSVKVDSCAMAGKSKWPKYVNKLRVPHSGVGNQRSGVKLSFAQPRASKGLMPLGQICECTCCSCQLRK